VIVLSDSELRLAGHPPSERYIGHTSELKQRIAEHNSGKCVHTAKFVPWNLCAYIAFPNFRITW
jgi:predicted GIY-YIG superfamily endonuclease